MVTIKSLSECTFEEGTKAWNLGFEGYFFDATSTVERFTARLGMEGLSPELSIVAFDGADPIGLVLSGVRMIEGKKVAWNGGTGVASPYRRQGVGRQLMQRAIEVYQKAEVDIATLEAFSQNEKAIALYQQLGYQIVDRLLFLQRTEGFAESNPFEFETNGDLPYSFIKGIPQDVRTLSFYQPMAPWQTQWSGIRDGESMIAKDAVSGEAIGYALYKRSFDEQGKVNSINLYQCAATKGRADEEQIVKALLANVFAPFDLVCKRTTFNLPAANERVVRALQEAGFKPSNEQVYMIKQMEK